jgi:glycosyltransferase involved in cell wall biosynthesis
MRSPAKILYISNPFYLDYDLSLISHLSEETDLYYFLDISPFSIHATVLNVKNYIRTADILDGTAYGMADQFDQLPKDKTFIINRKTNRLSFSNFFLQFRLARLIRKIDPDIIHFNTDFNHNYFLLHYLFRIPVICTIHDPIPHSGDDTFKEALKRSIFYRFITNFIILNNEQRNEFINRYKLHEKEVFVSTLGVYDYLLRNKPLKTKGKYSSSYNSIQILFFGRINKYKGIGNLLIAFKSIVSKYPGATLVLAGKGDPEVSNIENQKNVFFINRHIENEELSRLIAESDFVVCPYTDATQSGVIMTAFAFCKPVIATDVGGLKNFVDDGVTGILIEPGNPEKLEEAIEKFILHPEILNQISRNILDKYHNGVSSWTSIARSTVEIYRSICR